MAIQARVTSSEALETFRAKLIVFINKARLSVDDVTDEVRRMRSSLQNELPMRWEGEIRRLSKKLEQAQSELQNAHFAGGQAAAVQTRQAAVNRLKQSLTEAEDKLRRIKKWNQNYDNLSDPVVKRLENFRGFVTDELPKAVAHLSNVQKVLATYAETSAPAGSSGPSTSPSPDAPAESGGAEPSTVPSTT